MTLDEIVQEIALSDDVALLSQYIAAEGGFWELRSAPLNDRGDDSGVYTQIWERLDTKERRVIEVRYTPEEV